MCSLFDEDIQTPRVQGDGNTSSLSKSTKTPKSRNCLYIDQRNIVICSGGVYVRRCIMYIETAASFAAATSMSGATLCTLKQRFLHGYYVAFTLKLIISHLHCIYKGIWSYRICIRFKKESIISHLYWFYKGIDPMSFALVLLRNVIISHLHCIY